MLFVLSLLLFTSTANGQCSNFPRADRQCGPSVNNAGCRSDECCSAFGWCGKGTSYCTTPTPLCVPGGLETTRHSSSQCAAAVRSDQRCGPRFGNSMCAPGHCCSAYSWCGVGSIYCISSVCSLAPFPDTINEESVSPQSSATALDVSPSESNLSSSLNLISSAELPLVSVAASDPSSSLILDATVEIPLSDTESHLEPDEAALTTADHLVPLCSAAPRTDNRCGSGYGNSGCVSGQCCDQFNRCGFGAAFCNARSICSSSVPISENGFSSFNWCGPTKSIALTFDDSQFVEPSITDLLDDLARLHLTATFFMTAANYPSCDTIQRVLDDGHTLQSHSMSHLDSTKLTAQQLAYEVASVPNWIQSTCGISVQMSQFRPPFSIFNSTLVHEINRLGYTLSSWTLDTHDSEDYTLQQSQDVISKDFDALPPGSSAIIVGHDVGYSSYGVKGILDFYVNKFTPLGYKFISMDQCFHECLALNSCQAPPNFGPGIWSN